MCGIAGAVALWNSASWGRDQIIATVSEMTGAIAHRGPDDHGVWMEQQGQIALGHRRLSIVDLSPRGKQPMHYGNRFVIVFNGEIYNHRKLRHELVDKGHRFSSETDTEVLMAAVQEWGIEQALRRATGMFAFALWDTQRRRLYLSRDRLGEKPLFVAIISGYLVFASEFRALELLTLSSLPLSKSAISQYLNFGYVPAPFSMREGIYKLPAASLLTVDPAKGCEFKVDDLGGSLQVHGNADLRRYWQLNVPSENTKQTSSSEDNSSQIDELDSLVRSAVHSQMQSDVPMGVFLSGGIDSTVVAASAQSQSQKPISTFTVKFDVPGYDESEHAAAISRHLKTNHHEITLSPQHLVESIPRLASSLDEPTANASYFALHAMASEARRSVKVILTGDGGDELFGGYNRYRLTVRLWRKISRIPLPIRLSLARALAWAPTVTDTLVGVAGRNALSGQVQGGVASKKLIRVLESASLSESYQRLMWCWDSPASIANVDDMPLRSLAWTEDTFLSNASLLDLQRYLPDDNLAKSDRATMAAGLEVRVPLLDHNIVQFACGLPDHLRIKDGMSKWVLRQLAYRSVPRELLERPKMGFTVPIDNWLRGPLNEWAGDLLASRELLEKGMLRPKPIAKAWQAYTRKLAPIGWEIWSVVMYAAWLDGRRAATA